MDLVVSLEHRFHRTPNGRIWTEGLNAYDFWSRYLDVFEGVKVLARMADVSTEGTADRQADGPGVQFVPVPNYHGIAEYTKAYFRVRAAIRRGLGPSDAVLLRVSSPLADVVQRNLTDRPFGLEVVGDPYDAWSPGAVYHPLRPICRWWFTRRLKKQCQRAVAVAYVTQHALQERYSPGGYSVGVSDVELTRDAILESNREKVARLQAGHPRGFRLVAVGSLAQMYKGIDILIQGVAGCVSAGLDLSVTVVGGGKHQSELEGLAERLGIASRVRFLGNLPSGSRVREELDAADLFVMPSRQEGLPRAMVEAMARALPCIGSEVGGIPELLPADCLFPAGDAPALSRKIQEVLARPDRLIEMSSRNLAHARMFRDEVLASTRRAFYLRLREATSEWLASSSRSTLLQRDWEGC